MPFQRLVSVVVRVRAGGHDQVVVVAVSERRLDLLGRRIYVGHLRHADVHILPPLKQLPEGEYDTTWLQSGHRDLVKQRLKLVVVIPIDQHDLEVGLHELARQL